MSIGSNHVYLFGLYASSHVNYYSLTRSDLLNNSHIAPCWTGSVKVLDLDWCLVDSKVIACIRSQKRIRVPRTSVLRYI